MKIALIVLNWNGEHLLRAFLPELIKNSRNDVDIYVVDNASTDGSFSYVRETFQEIIIIRHQKNEGYARGYNLALSEIRADIFGLINSDIQVSPHWLDPIIKFYQNEEKSDILQPKILDFKNKSKFEYAGAAGGFLDKYGYSFCRGRIFNHLEEDEGQYASDSIFWASGACFFIKSETFKLLNGFDEDFFAHYEEIDLCWRAHHEKIPIHYIESSVVFHVGAETLKNANPLKTYLNFRNALFTLTKNLPKKNLFRILIVRLLLDAIAGIRFLILGQFCHLWSILKAHCSFYRQFFKMYKKRGNTQKEDYYQIENILIEFFIKGRKTFESLMK